MVTEQKNRDEFKTAATSDGLESIYNKRKLGDDDMLQIIRAYESCLLRYTVRFVNDHNSAEDVVQDTFIKLFGSWKKIKDRQKNLKSWLYRVAHNKAIDLIRKEQNYRKAMKNHAENLLNSESETHEEENLQRKHKIVLDNIDKLSPAEKEVLLLRLEEGLSYKDISQTTNRAIGNVGKLLHRAVGKITGELKAQGVIQ
jgi:RNA polymerase sigma-70 factor (ECF subfamily)